MKNYDTVLSPGVLHTQFGDFRLVRSHPINRDDYPYKAWNTFLATPKAALNEVHVPARAITVAGYWSVDWFSAFIMVALPREDDPEYRLLVEDGYTDQEPVVAMPDYYSENDIDGYSCCGDEGV